MAMEHSKRTFRVVRAEPGTVAAELLKPGDPVLIPRELIFSGSRITMGRHIGEICSTSDLVYQGVLDGPEAYYFTMGVGTARIAGILAQDRGRTIADERRGTWEAEEDENATGELGTAGRRTS